MYTREDLVGRTKLALKKILDEEFGGLGEALRQRLNSVDNSELVEEILRRQTEREVTAQRQRQEAEAERVRKEQETAAKKKADDDAAAEKARRVSEQQETDRAAARREQEEAAARSRTISAPPPPLARDIDEEDEEDEEEDLYEEEEEEEEEDEEDEIPQRPQPVSPLPSREHTTKVSSGASSKSLHLIGQTVGQVRRDYREFLNIAADSQARINGQPVRDDRVITENDRTLEFTKVSGGKS